MKLSTLNVWTKRDTKKESISSYKHSQRQYMQVYVTQREVKDEAGGIQQWYKEYADKLLKRELW